MVERRGMSVRLVPAKVGRSPSAANRRYCGILEICISEYGADDCGTAYASLFVVVA